MDQVAQTALFVVIMVEFALVVAVFGLMLGRQRDRREVRLLKRMVSDANRHQDLPTQILDTSDDI